MEGLNYIHHSHHPIVALILSGVSIVGAITSLTVAIQWVQLIGGILAIVSGALAARYYLLKEKRDEEEFINNQKKGK